MERPRAAGRTWFAPLCAGLVLLAADPPTAILAQEESGAERMAASGSPLLHEAWRARQRANEAGASTQARIDEISSLTDERYARYTAALSQLESLRGYNHSMRELVEAQDEKISSLRTELEKFDVVSRSVMPLMSRMIDRLEDFVALDHPFLVEERRERIHRLRQMMIRADVTESEKYRQVMEAYQIEIEYGRTIEAYRAALQPGGSGETVDFLRFGRIALLYLSFDGKSAGVWDARTRAWTRLDDSYIADVQQGLRVAREQIAADLVNLPLPAPEGAEPEGRWAR